VERDSLKVESNFEEDNVRNGVCKISDDMKLQDCTRFNDRYEDFLNDTSNNIHSPGRTSKSKFMLHTLLLNRINFILLAGIVNILLVLRLDHLFGQVCMCVKFYISEIPPHNNLHVLLTFTGNYYTLLAIDSRTFMLFMHNIT